MNYGLDFGTSNTTLAHIGSEGAPPQTIPLELTSNVWNDGAILPSLYFQPGKKFIGTEAQNEVTQRIARGGGTAGLPFLFDFKRDMASQDFNNSIARTYRNATGAIFDRVKENIRAGQENILVVGLPVKDECSLGVLIEKWLKDHLRGDGIALKFVSEPIALAFGAFANIPNRNMLIFDFGGGTLDMAFLPANGVPRSEVLECGGAILNEKIMKELIGASAFGPWNLQQEAYWQTFYGERGLEGAKRRFAANESPSEIVFDFFAKNRASKEPRNVTKELVHGIFDKTWMEISGKLDSIAKGESPDFIIMGGGSSLSQYFQNKLAEKYGFRVSQTDSILDPQAGVVYAPASPSRAITMTAMGLARIAGLGDAGRTWHLSIPADWRPSGTRRLNYPAPPRASPTVWETYPGR